MIDGDKLQKDMETHGEWMEDLMMRMMEQKQDIKKMHTELERLKAAISEE